MAVEGLFPIERGRNVIMDEIYWEIISFLYALFSIGITGYYLSRFLKPFLVNRRYAWLSGVVYFAVMFIFHQIPLYINKFIAYGAGVAAAFLVLLLVDYRNMGQKIYLAVTFFALRYISGGIAVSVSVPVTDGVYYLQAQADADLKQWFAGYVGVTVFLAAIHWFLIAAAVKCILKAYVYKKDNMSRREVFFSLLPSCSVLLGYIVFLFCEEVYEADTGKTLYGNYLYQCLTALYQLISFAAILAVVIIFQDIKRRQKEEKQREILAGQVESMKMHISEVEKLYRDIRSLKHDMGNHITTLERLYEKKEYGAAQEYMTQLRRQFHDTASGIKSGNPVTDVILTERQKEARERGIDFLCEFFYPEGTGINAFDISVILNNAVTNALEGAAGCRHPYIHVLSYRKKNAYMIEITNSFMGKVSIEEESGLPETTKSDRNGHGFGLANIREAAQKYYGDIEIEQTVEEFKLSVLLIIP